MTVVELGTDRVNDSFGFIYGAQAVKISQVVVDGNEAIGRYTPTLLDTRLCYMSVASDKPEIHYRGGEIIEDVDAVIPRIGASITFYGTAMSVRYSSSTRTSRARFPKI